MRPLILSLLLLLLSAICSCRTTRQSVSESADSTMVEISETRTSLSTDEILSLINSSRELDLSGITVEFFPPDSAHPAARAAPKSLTIENAKAKEQSNAATHQVATIEENDTVNVNLAQSSAQAESTRSDAKILSPLDWVVTAAVLIAIILLIIAIYLSFKKTRQ